MISSRNIDDLDPRVAKLCNDFIAACKIVDIDILITSTYRDKESQDALYAQGRTAPGHVVTAAKGGQSFHQYKLAFDFCPIVNGKPDWNNLDTFKRCGKIGKAIGLDWAGDWTGRMIEYAHFQWTGGLTLVDLQAGKYP